ncbi:hypothetical protein [Mesorhizobium sp.]|uniref:hypothetical protein n=1 Tax=Mesorhizobium sp. TaxID=1871066 RepID=UPI0025F06DDE|nr:hypothetical protein [Mesorhizobium sp.]
MECRKVSRHEAAFHTKANLGDPLRPLLSRDRTERSYVDVAVLRWQDFTGQAAVLEGDERTFAEIAAARAGGVA